VQQRPLREQQDFSSLDFDLFTMEFVTLQTAPPPLHLPVETIKLLLNVV
jgi:hypothetical protein